MKSDYSDKFSEKIIRVVMICGLLFYFLLATQGENGIKYYIGNELLVFFYIIFGLSGLYVLTERDFYLPFLGDAVFPDGLLQPQMTPMSANMQHVLKGLPPLTKVMYWAAEPCEVTETCGLERMPWESYNDFTNAGTTMSDKNGDAAISIRGKPQSYNVPYKSEVIMPHVHYRFRKNNGMYSKVFTNYIK
jgi:hypothetical protein